MLGSGALGARKVVCRHGQNIKKTNGYIKLLDCIS